MKNLPLLFLAIIVSTTIFAQNVNIPDANFKAALVGNSAINTNMDTEIQTSEATAFTGGMNAGSLAIADLTGIEAFTALTSLDCGGNSLTSLTISTNTALTYLYCGYNSLTSLDVSTNMALTSLDCGYNSLTSLTISANTALISLYCNTNSLTSLNVKNGNNVNFVGFNATDNPNLTCVLVDDTAYMNVNWASAVDAGASYNDVSCTVGIKEQDFLSNVAISPNPTKSTFVLAVTSSRNTVLNMNLTNSLGQVVLSHQSNLNIGLNEVNFDIQNQPSGIYFMSINYENNHFIKKIMKQ
ncbi:MAG: hypothetical protein CO118_10475 [Flavobacteriales bacterium CG_4_9_14_3_um_filter_32_8]|nr:MAG: hypothetical protein CO118_10475 [Flavobacteriales bacterium CG_4_9_14_3_um_filter_32_8]